MDPGCALSSSMDADVGSHELLVRVFPDERERPQQQMLQKHVHRDDEVIKPCADVS
jgi:hypothetical protein